MNDNLIRRNFLTTAGVAAIATTSTSALAAEAGGGKTLKILGVSCSLGSPSYFRSLSGLAKCLLERLAPPREPRMLLADKPFGVVVVGASRTGRGRPALQAPANEPVVHLGAREYR